jgi:hypothetical protein
MIASQIGQPSLPSVISVIEIEIGGQQTAEKNKKSCRKQLYRPKKKQ